MLKKTIIITLFFISFGVYGQTDLFVFDSAIVYARSATLPSFIDSNICHSNYIRENNDVRIVIKKKLIKGDLFEDIICKTFLSKNDDTIVANFPNDLLYSIIVIDFLKANSIIETVSLCKFNYFVRNDDYSKVFFIKPRMTQFIENEFHYILNDHLNK